MNTSRIFLLSLVLVAAPPVVTADDGASESRAEHRQHARGDRRNNPERMLARMQRILDLTELQTQNIENVILAAQPQIEALREASRSNRQALRALDNSSPDYAERLAEVADEKGRLTSRKTQIFGNLRADIEALLTDEQRAELKTAMDRRDGFRKGRRSERRRQRAEERATSS